MQPRCIGFRSKPYLNRLEKVTGSWVGNPVDLTGSDMPEIEEISAGKSTPNKSTAPAEGPNITANGDPQHDHESTEGQEKV